MERRRKFKLLTQEGWDISNLTAGRVYFEDCLPYEESISTVLDLVEMYPQDWKEVFDEEDKQEKPLHKDTDLGYFAGLIVSNGIIGSEITDRNKYIKACISLAKELIKALDNENP